jgi:hypothetical protein
MQRQPFSFDPMKIEFLKVMADYSNMIWTYMGYSGLLQPWHDSSDLSGYLYRSKEIKRRKKVVGRKRPFDDFWNKFNELDMSLWSYAFLILPLNSPERFETPLQCYNSPGYAKWAKALRDHCGSLEACDKVSLFVLKHLQLQVEYFGRASLNSYNLSRPDDNSRYLGIYYSVFQRICQLESQGIDIESWQELKFLNIRKAFPKQVVPLSTVSRINNFDHNLDDLVESVNDTWRPMREFLELSVDCEFTEGCIPKGWVPVSDPKDIVKIDAAGAYIDSKGAQRVGKCHYMGKSYDRRFLIKCDMSNLEGTGMI